MGFKNVHYRTGYEIEISVKDLTSIIFEERALLQMFGEYEQAHKSGRIFFPDNFLYSMPTGSLSF